MKKIVLLLFFSLSFSQTLDEIRESGILRVGIFGNNPPFTYDNSPNLPTGFNIAFVEAMVKDLFKGVEIIYVPLTSSDRMKAVTNGEIDILVAELANSPKRSQIANTSMPYFMVNVCSLSKKDRKIQKIGDLKELNIGYLKGSSADTFVKKNNFFGTPCEDAKECYDKLKQDEIDTFVVSNLIALKFAVIDLDLEIGIRSVEQPLFYVIYTQKGNDELTKFINQRIIDLSKEGFFKAAYDETFNPFYKGLADKKHFLLDDIYRFLVK